MKVSGIVRTLTYSSRNRDMRLIEQWKAPQRRRYQLDAGELIPVFRWGNTFMSSVWGTHSCFPEGRGNLIMSSTGGTYSSLPLGEHIHVFRWGALFQSSDGGTHSCLPLGGLIPVFRWGALFMFSVGGPYSGLPLGGFIHVFGELIQSTHQWKYCGNVESWS